MHIERLNQPVFQLDDAHPAKRFLKAFIECRKECVGRELAPPGELPVDQSWYSPSDARSWTFSAFAYGFISFDIELDGLMGNVPNLTDSETWALQELPRFRVLMRECAEAARENNNTDCLDLVDTVVDLLKLWEDYLNYRQQMVSQQQQ